jgi:hypothetical protein
MTKLFQLLATICFVYGAVNGVPLAEQLHDIASNAFNPLMPDDLEWKTLRYREYRFDPLPLTESLAISAGWQKEKSCGEVNGNRYILNNDKISILIFNAQGSIAGAAMAIPKNSSNGYPSKSQAKAMNDEGDQYTVSFYLVDPASVCDPKAPNKTAILGDRLAVRGDGVSLDVPLSLDLMAPLSPLPPLQYAYCNPVMMGDHYFPNYDNVSYLDDPVNTFPPIVFMYSHSKLVGVEFQIRINLNSSVAERYVPTILTNMIGYHSDYTILHYYFIEKPWLDTCLI